MAPAVVLTPAEYWDREVTAPPAPPAHSWTAHPLVRSYINRSVSGREGGWPLDWFQETYPNRRFRRALSIGCGTGALERDLVRRGIVDEVEAFDLSEKSLAIARQEAEAQGLSQRVRYFVADFDAVELPANHYDLICFHQSLHHVSKLERLLTEVRRAITPDGLLYLDEFIGPSRSDWDAYRLRWYRALYLCLPRDVRYFDLFPMPIQEDDPSEAIRSSEIYSRLAIAFDVEHFRGYGGNVMAVIFPSLMVSDLTDAQVQMLIEAERALIESGDPHFHAVITARPKQGEASRTLAKLRYAIEPRFPRSTGRLRDLVRHFRGRERTG